MMFRGTEAREYILELEAEIEQLHVLLRLRTEDVDGLVKSKEGLRAEIERLKARIWRLEASNRILRSGINKLWEVGDGILVTAAEIAKVKDDG